MVIMDPASLSLAVIPLLALAIKAYGAVQKKFKVFSHYSREVRRICKQLDRQQQFFRNETHLLVLPAVKDASVVECMLEDAGHAKWQSKDLEAALQETLAKNYDTCLELIEEIGGAIKSLQQELQCFDQIESQRRKGEPLKDTVRRLRHAVKIALDKSKFEICIADLRELNDDIRRLRKQSTELQKSASRAKETIVCRKQLDPEYRQFGDIRRASNALHVALTAAWSKPKTVVSLEGLQHHVKLFVDAKVDDGVCMDMAVLCYGHDVVVKTLLRPILSKLQVRSQVLDWVETGLDTPPPSEDGRQKRRKVHFPDDCIALPVTPKSPLIPESLEVQPPLLVNLSNEDMCETLVQRRPGSNSSQTVCCLGYLDACVDQTFRHSFYRNDSDHSFGECKLQLKGLVSMGHIFQCSAEHSLSIVDQLKLAYSMVTTVLKFHSTPWLRHYFSVNDLSLFRTKSELSQCLQTLHFGAEFTQSACVEPQPACMQGLESTGSGQVESMAAAIENAKMQYGIRNMTLWSLGAILLQIGQWTRIESPDDVLTVRKLSTQVSALGPRYQQLTKKCLDCDFGYGEDLSKPGLQQAVYENLVGELSDMIRSLEIKD